MDLNINDRILIKKDRGYDEAVVKEIYGDYIRTTDYPYWRQKNDLDVVGKLPTKEPINTRTSLLLKTEGLTCPLLKQICNRQCAWYIQHANSCIVLQFSEDINTIVNESDT